MSIFKLLKIKSEEMHFLTAGDRKGVILRKLD